MEDKIKNCKKYIMEIVRTILKVDFSLVLSRFLYYAKIWIMMSKNAFMSVLTQKKLFFLFLSGKIIRFSFFGLFLYFLVQGAGGIVGYDVDQAVFFFLTFNVIDIISQFLFREIYRFRPLLISGDFDLILLKPFNSLFRVLMGGADIIDLFTIPPLIMAVIYIGGKLNPTAFHIFLYIVLIISGLLIAAAFHILVASLGIITLDVDHTIMIYRDFVNLGRFPIEIYRQPLQGVLTYLIPLGVMIAVPARALMGFVSIQGVLLSFFISFIGIYLSLRFWKYAIKKYTSASS